MEGDINLIEGLRGYNPSTGHHPQMEGWFIGSPLDQLIALGLPGFGSTWAPNTSPVAYPAP